MNKELILHIGSHKTGTTSIQKALLENQHLLGEHGYALACKTPSGTLNRNGILHDWIDLSEFSVDHRKACIRSSNKLAESLADSQQQKTIGSSENFSFIFDEKQISDLHKELANFFSKISIIIYIRRQDTLAISHHQEGATKQWNAEVSYYKGNKALPIFSREQFDYLDYYEKLTKWANHFGKQNIIIRVFDKRLMTGGDVVKDFFNLIGISDIGTARENTSRSFIKSKVGGIINNTLKKSLFTDILRDKLPAGGKMLPSRKEAEEFYSYYIDSNIRLNEEFEISKIYEDIFPRDFTRYPENPGDEWTEELANNAIESVLTTISPISELNKYELCTARNILGYTSKHSSEKFGKILQSYRSYGSRDYQLTNSDTLEQLVSSADFLRDLAITFETSDILLARSIMRKAQQLRPEGRIISDKISEYQNRIDCA